MKCFAKSLTVAASLVLPAVAAHADPMMTGVLSIQGSSVTTSTGVTFVSGSGSAPSVDATGTFQGLFPASDYGTTPTYTTDNVSLNSFTYSAVNSSAAPGTLIFTVDSTGTGGNLTLYLTNVTDAPCDTGATCVDGTGTLEEAGYANTPGTVTLTTQEAGMTDVTFSATTMAAATPEPSSLLLIGTGLLGSAGALYRRNRTTHAA